MSTIYDVARLAGVSKTTVSKILNGNQNVRPATLKKVNDAIRELEYVPSSFAQNLRKNSTHTIAVLLPEQYNYGYMEFLAGIEACAQQHGYLTFVCSTGREGQREEKYLREMLRRRVEAIIYFAYRRREKTLEQLARVAKNTAVVVMDPILQDERLDSVCVDGAAGVRSAVCALAQKGCRRIACICAKTGDATAERYAGYLQGLSVSGLELHKNLVAEAEFTMDGGARAMQRLWAEKPDAVVAVTDMLALGALDWCATHGVSVPKEVSIVGFDGIPLCEWSVPRLSTVVQRQRTVGETAVRRLLARIADPKLPVEHILLPCELVLRDTTR